MPPLFHTHTHTEVSLMEADPAYLFRFPTPPDLPAPPILGFTDVDFGYPGGPTLFHNLNFGCAYTRSNSD
jgi:ATP-binding cassette subfamily F protein 3